MTPAPEKPLSGEGESRDRQIAAIPLGSGVAEDLLDARMRHARSGSHGTVALAIRNGGADRFAPLTLGTGTPRGGAAHTDEAIHLVGDSAVAEQRLSVRLRLGIARVAGLLDEGLRPLVVEGVALGDLCLGEANGADLCSGHVARILARGEFVK